MSFEKHQRRRFNSWESVNGIDDQEGIHWPFHSVGRPDDVLQPKGAICQEISKLLGRVVQGTGAYTFSGKFDDLPGHPGLFVQGFGGISLPLRKEQASVLLTPSADEGNVWTFLPYQVAFTNPQWSCAILALCQLSADKLGFKGIALQPVLSKVSVFAAGGRRVVQQDAYEHDRVVAKMVVQLPSEFTGGDLLVSGSRMNRLRCYDLGTVDGTAVFKPHYAVYAADAFCSVKEVTSGYRVLVEYSLYLPPEFVANNGKLSFDLLQIQVQLAEAMKKLKEPEEYKVKSETANGRTDDGENSLIALLLSQTCTRSQIESKGVTGLSGMDHDRMKLLLDANTLLPPEKQLVFRFVCLQHTNRIASSVNEAKLCASWFRLNGEKLGDDISFDWTKRLHFLNPGNELLRKSWGNARYIYSDCIYERCAVVAWPASADVVLSYELMGEYAATASILAKNPIDTAKLQELFIYRAYHLDQSAESTNNRNRAGCYAQKNNTVIYTVVPLTFCQKLCKAIGELGDVTLVDIFLMTYFVRLFDKVKLIPLLAELVRIFGWNAIEASILSALDGLLYDILMKLVMLLADELKDCQEAQTALMKYGLGKLKCVAAVTTTTFSTSCDLGLLWKNAMTCNDPQVFREVVELAKKIDVAMLGPVVNELSELVNRSSSGEHQAGWVAIACSRLQWLTAEIAAMEKPFQWQVLVSDCPDADDIVTFLQGPNKTLELTGFGSIVDARARVKALLSTITAPLEITANGRGSLSFVKIVKTSGVFAQNSKELAAYKAEAGHLTHLLQPSDVVNSMAEDANTSKVAVENSNACCDIETTNIVGNKRPREEEADVNAMSNTEGLQ